MICMYGFHTSDTDQNPGTKYCRRTGIKMMDLFYAICTGIKTMDLFYAI